jgi:hypothetical protein
MEKKKLIRTVIFLAVLGGILGFFAFLSSTSKPPDLPIATPQHKLRFNLKNELIGVESDPPVDPAQATAAHGFVVEKKAVEKRIHEGCTKCHSAGGEAGPLKPTHPVKTECIKCHRMPAGK